MSCEERDETSYLVSSSVNNERLRQALQEADDNDFVEVDLSLVDKD